MQREGLDTRMSKIAIVTDSNSGITQAEGARRGIHVLPMPFMIDEVTYYEDIDLTQEQFYEKLKSGANIATSQPSPDSVTSLWDKLLQEYDEIVHIPMSSGLSGSCQSAMAFAADYDGKVQVVNNQRISVTQRQSALDALQLAAAGKNAAILGAQGSAHHKVAVRRVSSLPGRKGHPDELLLFFQSQFCHGQFSFLQFVDMAFFVLWDEAVFVDPSINHSFKKCKRR